MLRAFAIFLGLSISLAKPSSTASSEMTSTVRQVETKLAALTFRNGVAVHAVHISIHYLRLPIHTIPLRNRFMMNLCKLSEIIPILHV